MYQGESPSGGATLLKKCVGNLSCRLNHRGVSTEFGTHLLEQWPVIVCRQSQQCLTNDVKANRPLGGLLNLVTQENESTHVPQDAFAQEASNFSKTEVAGCSGE